MAALHESASAFLKATILESVTSLNMHSHSMLSSLGNNNTGYLAAAAVSAMQTVDAGGGSSEGQLALPALDMSFLAATNSADGHEGLAAWPSASMHYHGYKYSELNANQQTGKLKMVRSCRIGIYWLLFCFFMRSCRIIP